MVLTSARRPPPAPPPRRRFRPGSPAAHLGTLRRILPLRRVRRPPRRSGWSTTCAPPGGPSGCTRTGPPLGRRTGSGRASPRRYPPLPLCTAQTITPPTVHLCTVQSTSDLLVNVHLRCIGVKKIQFIVKQRWTVHFGDWQTVFCTRCPNALTIRTVAKKSSREGRRDEESMLRHFIQKRCDPTLRVTIEVAARKLENRSLTKQITTAPFFEEPKRSWYS